MFIKFCMLFKISLALFRQVAKINFWGEWIHLRYIWNLCNPQTTIKFFYLFIFSFKGDWKSIIISHVMS